MPTKRAILECLEVSSANETITYNENFLDDVKQALRKSTSVEDRKYELKDVKENGESQFISDFTEFDDCVFCTFIHMEAGAAANIMDTLLKEKTFSIEEADTDGNRKIKGHIKTMTYFLMGKNYLILKRASRLDKSDIQIYINYLLTKKIPKFSKKASTLKLENKIDSNYDVTRIKSFEVAEGYSFTKENPFKLVEKQLKLDEIMTSAGLENLDPEMVLSASIVFKIKNLPKNNKKEQKKLMQKIFDTFNTGSVTFKDKNNTTVNVDTAKKTCEINMVLLESGYPDRNKLKEEMYSLFTEVSNEGDDQKNS